MIRVLLVDDHRVILAGLEELLDPVSDIEVVAVANDGVAAIKLASIEGPDVVVMDISMPRMDGIEATRRILKTNGIKENSLVRVVMLTAHTSDERVIAAVDVGASGYLLKDMDPAEIVDGIRATAAGDSPFDPRAAKTLISTRVTQTAGRRSGGGKLTEREREVLLLVTEGLANKCIARRLDIAEKTVKSHLTRVYESIGVDCRTQAALWACDHGLVPERTLELAAR